MVISWWFVSGGIPNNELTTSVQYPNQFAPYLHFLSSLDVDSYIEIGCRFGGTFLLTVEYLSRFRTLGTAVAVDIAPSPVEYACLSDRLTCEFVLADSSTDEFRRYLGDTNFTLAFIDGDHSYEGVRRDYLLMRERAKVLVFHDVASSSVPGVGRLWREVKSEGDFEIHEFIQQYPDVRARGGGRFFGIGVAVRLEV